MGWNQIVFGVTLVVVLLALAIYYGWRQIALLRNLPASLSEEHRFQRGLALRRLVNSGLMIVLGGLLVSGMMFLERPAQDLADQQDARELAGQETKLTGKDRDFARLYGFHTIALLLVLLAIVALAGADLWAIRRYSRAQFKKLHDDRRAMIERETARLREERNGADDILRN